MATPAVPNVLITGTPGTGKTTTAAEVAQMTGWQHINIGDWVKEKELHSGWDDEFDCWIVDEDKARAGGSTACIGDRLPSSAAEASGSAWHEMRISRSPVYGDCLLTGLRRVGGYHGARRLHCRPSFVRLLPREVSHHPCST